LELINNQYRRLARENRTDRASQLKAMVREGNQRWDSLHRRVAAILRRLKGFQKEITLNTERIDGLIVFGEALIQKSSPQDAALMEDELEELHSYCQEVFSRLVRFHQRLSQPLVSSPLERSGRETPVSVDSLPLEWDHTGDVGGSSSHEDDEEDEDHKDGGAYFSALSGVIERWELLRAQSRCDQSGTQDPQQITFDLDNIASWLESVNPELEHLLQSEPTGSVEDMEARTKELKEFHETLHSLLLWLAQAESRCYAVDLKHPETSEELQCRELQQASLQALWSQLQPNDGAEESDEAQEKLHVTGNKLRQLMKKVDQDLSTLQQRLLIQDPGCAAADTSQDTSQEATCLKTGSSTQRCMQRTGVFVQYNTVELEPFLLTPLLFCRQRRESSPPRSFFYRLLRAAFPLQLLLLLLLLLPCLIPLSESDPSCTVTNNFARSFYPMLHYTNGPPPT
ncbi:hypothetical protein GOODEAATRI_020708, partial [Goodea atripinnis]